MNIWYLKIGKWIYCFGKISYETLKKFIVMGSHYIQVGKLKIDQDLMDILCPAAGFTPELICPAAGYILEPGQPYIPPVDIGEPDEEQIWLLCEYSGYKCVYPYTTISGAGGKWYYEVYDINSNILHTSEELSSGASLYNFPELEEESGSLQYLIIKIKVTAGTIITKFKVYQNNNYGGGDYPILQAKFNTPNITELQYAFQKVSILKDVQFISTMANLTTLYYAFEKSGLQYWKPSTNFEALTTMQNAFSGSGIIRLDFSDSLFPLLENLSYVCYQAYSLYEVKFPSSLPSAENMSYAFRDSTIEYITMYTSAPNVTNYAGMFYNSYKLKSDIEVPVAEDCTSLLYFTYNCKCVESVIFNGIMPKLATISRAFQGANGLKYLELPTQIGDVAVSCSMNTFLQANYVLETLIVPDLAYPSEAYLWSYLESKLVNITGDGETPNQSEINGNVVYGANLEVYDVPKLTVATLWIGTSAAADKLSEIEIDWANSTWSTIANTIRIKANLDSTEIDRIFTALPVVVGGQSIYVSYNPGYAGCDPSIATAKGWTVT